MFSFFKKKKSKRESDKIWRTQTAKLAGILKDVAQKNQNDVLIVAHFNDTFETLKRVIEIAGVSCSEIRSSNDIERRFFSISVPSVFIALSDTVASFQFYENPAYEEQLKSKRLFIIAAEHYPVPSKDQAILGFGEKLPFESAVCFHESLDSPMLKLFGADRMAEKLSLDPEDCISHSFIDKAILNAQEKIARKTAGGDLPAHSMEQWMELNYPKNL